MSYCVSCLQTGISRLFLLSLKCCQQSPSLKHQILRYLQWVVLCPVSGAIECFRHLVLNSLKMMDFRHREWRGSRKVVPL
ncbi:uncharacterized protein LOC121868824 isoform X3 [Homarus americanus]|uniref:uncharacterized protein LOC121868824 isoform X3 n=1 Tax=Homarus americanus TaxID=6706 RepID=UPI001C47F883|nr:uncharacterized protein LOC121868824 isoform X3 [Homarus americanus]